MTLSPCASFDLYVFMVHDQYYSGKDVAVNNYDLDRLVVEGATIDRLLLTTGTS